MRTSAKTVSLRHRASRAVHQACTGLAAWCVLTGGLVLAEPSAPVDFSGTKLTRRLTAPMTTVIDGQSIDAALRSLQAASQINLWLDRDLDTSEVISNLQLGPTLYDALKKLARLADAQILPVGGVVMIGSDEWLDRFLVQSSLASSDDRASSVPISISWPDAVTPSELLRFVRTANRAASARDGGIAQLTISSIGVDPNLSDELVHDHLRGGRWIGVDQSRAEELLEITCGSESQKLADETPSAESQRWTVRYASTLPRMRLAKPVFLVDKAAKLVVRDDVATLVGTASSHREIRIAILDGLVAARQKQQRNNPNQGGRTFDLIVENEPAGKVLASLAASSGRTLAVDDAVAPVLEQLISFQAESKTLEELSRMVGQQIQLELKWTRTEIVVAAAGQDLKD